MNGLMRAEAASVMIFGGGLAAGTSLILALAMYLAWVCMESFLMVFSLLVGAHF